jgi:hypothetical protein
VIALLRNNGPNTGLRRTEIMVASKIRLGTEPPAPTYNKVRFSVMRTVRMVSASNVSGLVWVTHLDQIRIVEWCVVRFGSKNGYGKQMYLKET